MLYTLVSLKGSDSEGTYSKTRDGDIKPFRNINKAMYCCPDGYKLVIHVDKGYYKERVRLIDNVYLIGNETCVDRLIATGNTNASCKNITIYVNNENDFGMDIEENASIKMRHCLSMVKPKDNRLVAFLKRLIDI